MARQCVVLASRHDFSRNLIRVGVRDARPAASTKARKREPRRCARVAVSARAHWVTTLREGVNRE